MAVEENGTGEPSKSRKNLIIGVVVVGVLAIVGIVVGVVVSSGGGDDPSPSPATPPPPPPPPSTDSPVALTLPPPTDAPVISPPPTDAPVAPPPTNPPTNPPTDPQAPPPPTSPPTNPPTDFQFTPTTVAAEVIAGVARFGGSEFQDPASYQSRSLAWVETTSAAAQLETSVQRQSAEADKVVQLYSLACIWFATNAVQTIWTDATFGAGQPIPGWISTSGWLTDTDECTWYGITCDSMGRVTIIELNENKLTGSFPPEVALLHASLEALDLFDNLVFNEGDEGFDFFPELTNLKQFLHGSTAFQYLNGIPPAIGRMTNLEEYDCSFSVFFGPIDGSIFDDMTNLFYLVLDGNSYNSTIPDQIGLLPNLESFYAADAYISGDLSFMYSMPSIYEFWVDTNPGLGGSISTEIGNMPTLGSFSITDCDFTGTLPTELGNLVDMEQMWFYLNRLSGTIPSEFGNMLSAEVMDFSSNEFVGEMPPEICALRFPFGILEELGADCEGEVECATNCCTCCGSVCYE